MDLCDKNHDQICFDGWQCPFCRMISDKDDQIDDLQNQISSLESEIAKLEKEIENL